MVTNQFTIYSSSDPQGPGLITGLSGSLITILDACLVNGYGTGSYYKSGSGWTKPFANSASADGSPVYGAWTQGTGSMFTLFVNDARPNVVPGGKEAWATGWETLSQIGPSGTGSVHVGVGAYQFPTSDQLLTTGHVVIRKSNTETSVGRNWVLVADGATFYMWILTGDSAIAYRHWGFGDIYSLRGTADSWNCVIIGRYGENSAAGSQTVDYTDMITLGPYLTVDNAMVGGSMTGHYIARNSFGNGGSIGISRKGDSVVSSTGVNTTQPLCTTIDGVLTCPTGGDNSYYMCPLTVFESNVVAPAYRGRFRGLYQVGHRAGNFSDGQMISGSVDYTGKIFMIIKGGEQGSFWAVETSPTLEFN